MAASAERLSARAEHLDHIFSVLSRAQFGRRSERISQDQIELTLGDVETQHGIENAAAQNGRETMKCLKFSDSQIAFILQQADEGTAVA